MSYENQICFFVCCRSLKEWHLTFQRKPQTILVETYMHFMRCYKIIFLCRVRYFHGLSLLSATSTVSVSPVSTILFSAFADLVLPSLVNCCSSGNSISLPVNLCHQISASNLNYFLISCLFCKACLILSCMSV